MDAGCFIYINGTRLLQVPLLGKMYLSVIRGGLESEVASLSFVMEKEKDRFFKPLGKDRLCPRIFSFSNDEINDVILRGDINSKFRMHRFF